MYVKENRFLNFRNKGFKIYGKLFFFLQKDCCFFAMTFGVVLRAQARLPFSRSSKNNQSIESEIVFLHILVFLNRQNQTVLDENK